MVASSFRIAFIWLPNMYCSHYFRAPLLFLCPNVPKHTHTHTHAHHHNEHSILQHFRQTPCCQISELTIQPTTHQTMHRASVSLLVTLRLSSPNSLTYIMYNVTKKERRMPRKLVQRKLVMKGINRSSSMLWKRENRGIDKIVRKIQIAHTLAGMETNKKETWKIEQVQCR